MNLLPFYTDCFVSFSSDYFCSLQSFVFICYYMVSSLWKPRQYEINSSIAVLPHQHANTPQTTHTQVK